MTFMATHLALRTHPNGVEDDFDVRWLSPDKAYLSGVYTRVSIVGRILWEDGKGNIISDQQLLADLNRIE